MLLEFGWQNSVVALLAAINSIAGAPRLSAPIAPFRTVDIVTISAALQDGSYRPAQWFGEAGNERAQVSSMSAPVLEQSRSYDVFTLPVVPSMVERLSKRSGLVFDDPFYALLASYNLGRYGKRWVEVLVRNRERAWSQRTAIVAEIAGGTYRPERYFQIAGPAIVGAPAGVLPLSAHGVDGSALGKLYFLGFGDLKLEAGMGGMYQLYKYKAQ